MIRLIIGRLLTGVLVVFAVATFAFSMMNLAPGGPFSQDRELKPSVQAKFEATYNLNDGFGTRYFNYMKSLAKGDLGMSMKYPRTVEDIIKTHFGTSVILGLGALVFSIIFGLTAGVIAASRQNSWTDHSSMGIALLGISVPSFVLGNLLISFFSLELGWLPASRAETWRHFILPSMTLGMIYMGVIARLTRSGMLDTLRQDYIRTARAKGLSENKVVWKHAFRLGVMPVVTYLGPAIAALVTGSFVVEKVFQIPGLGRYFIFSVLDRDWFVMCGLLVFYSVFLIILNLIVDITYGFLDPRIRGR